MAEHTRLDKALTELQVDRLLKRAVAAHGGDWRAFYGGEEPSHDPVTGQKNPNAGDARPGYFRLVTTAEGVTDQEVAALVDGWDALPVVVSSDVIDADGVAEVTISLVYGPFVNDGDTAVDYEVFLDGESIQTGTRNVSGDTMAAATFSTNTPGEYELEVRRQTGFESGVVKITAVSP